MPPGVSYARSGDVAIAYQVVGSGPVDIVLVRVSSTVNHLRTPRRLGRIRLDPSL